MIFHFHFLYENLRGLEGRRCDGRLLVALRLATPVGGLGNMEGTEIRVPLLGGSVNNTSADCEDIKGCDKAKLKNFYSRFLLSFQKLLLMKVAHLEPVQTE